MSKRPPLAVILFVMIVCFALGLLNVLLKEPVDQSPTTTPISPTPLEADSPSIYSILIVGVNDLQSSDPQLRAIWIAAYRSSEDAIYLHGIPIHAIVPGGKERSLNDLFAWSSQKGLDEEFFDNLYQVIPLSPNLTIVMDDLAFEKIIDYLGGVEISGKTINGQNTLAFLSLFWEQPDALLEHQADMLRSLYPKALDLPESAELTELMSLIPEHVNLSMEISEAVALILPLRNVHPEAVFLILPENNAIH
jgi:hypothetical protein